MKGMHQQAETTMDNEGLMSLAAVKLPISKK